MSNFYPSKEQQEQIKEAAEAIQKSCANCNKGEAHTGKDCQTRSGCFTPLYKNWESIVEKPEKGKTDFTSRLVMEDWEISWGDEDHISIVGPHNQVCTMAGGDFESLLSALCGAYNRG